MQFLLIFLEKERVFCYDCDKICKKVNEESA
jgi:hypothetical protein